MKKFHLGIVFIVSVFSVNQASAVSINPDLINDFEDGSPHGWTKGAGASGSRYMPKVVQDSDGNHYLKVQSTGGDSDGRGPNSRMTVINETEWRGNYNIAGVGSIQTRMKNMGDETLFMRVGFTTRVSDEWHFAASKDPLELPADGNWYDLSFAISKEYIVPFLGNDGECCFPEWEFEDVIAGVNQLKFHNGKDNAIFWGGERVASIIGIDDIRVSTDVQQGIGQGSVLTPAEITPVPLPAAGWLFLTGVISLAGISSKKRLQSQL